MNEWLKVRLILDNLMANEFIINFNVIKPINLNDLLIIKYKWWKWNRFLNRFFKV